MSDPDQRRRAREIFLAIADLPQAEQTRFLEEACQNDARLHADIVALLRADDPKFMERPAAEVAGVTDHETVRLDGRGYSYSAWVNRLEATSPNRSRYESSEALRRGGMAEVMRVYEPTLRRHLAMKVLPAAAPDAITLGRFLEEAQVTAQLDHPGIVPVHELGVDDERRLFFTMKLVKGRDLREILGRNHELEPEWPRPRVLSVLLRCCEAMAYAHKKGVIHRDLKPANIMVGRYGETYVMDWGLARVRDEPGHLPSNRSDGQDSFRAVTSDRQPAGDGSGVDLETEDGTVIGTPCYMAPEQAAGLGHDVGPTADVYAMGAILYHVLAEHPPYLVTGAKVPAYTVLSWVLNGPPTPLQTEARDGEAELIAICDKAMAREPEGRYPDMEALATDLRAFLEGRVVQAHAVGAGAELKKWMRRNHKTAWVAFASLVVLCALASFAFMRIRAEAAVAQKALAETQDAHHRTQAAFDTLQAKILMRRIGAELWPIQSSGIPAMEEWLSEASVLRDRVDIYRTKLADPDPRWTQEHRTVVQGAIDAIALLLSEPSSADATNTNPTNTNPTNTNPTNTEPTSTAASLGGLSVVEQRLNVARQAASVHEGHRVAWDAARTRIADRERSPWYSDLSLAVQEGLVPIGQDTESGLEEFWHIPTGLQPTRSSDGAIRVVPEMGVVLVLIPGGTFRMGAQGHDEALANFDPETDTTEGPVREISLAPFFASKWELTQAQWKRMSGRAPSLQTGIGTLPVEQISFDDCVLWLGRHDLDLPTEAQWERLARARTDTPWFCGEDPSSCESAGNLADWNAYESARQASWSYELTVKDDFITSAPAGSFAANAFGIHDTLGNVFEWCRDQYVANAYQRTPVTDDGLCPALESDGQNRVLRGGSYAGPAFEARSAFRYHLVPSARSPFAGVRAVREVRPTF